MFALLICFTDFKTIMFYMFLIKMGRFWMKRILLKLKNYQQLQKMQVHFFTVMFLETLHKMSRRSGKTLTLVSF